MKKIFLILFLTAISISFAYAETWNNPTTDVVYTNGKVGIGTSDVARSLHIKGTPVIRLENSGHGSNFWEIQNADPFNLQQAFGIVRYEGSAIKAKSLLISKEGNVGIGSEPGTYKLFVDGNLRALNLNVADIDSNNIKVQQGLTVTGSASIGGGLRSVSLNTGAIDSDSLRVAQDVNVLGEANFGKSVAVSGNLRATNLNIGNVDSNQILTKEICFYDGTCINSSKNIDGFIIKEITLIKETIKENSEEDSETSTQTTQSTSITTPTGQELSQENLQNLERTLANKCTKGETLCVGKTLFKRCTGDKWEDDNCGAGEICKEGEPGKAYCTSEKETQESQEPCILEQVGFGKEKCSNVCGEKGLKCSSATYIFGSLDCDDWFARTCKCCGLNVQASATSA